MESPDKTMNGIMDSVPSQPEDHCANVNIQEIEEAGINIYNKIANSSDLLSCGGIKRPEYP